MRVLVTRPIEDATRTASRLVALGHEPVVAPLLEIVLRDDTDVSFEDAAAIIATSSNGVRAYARLPRRRDLPLFAVGEQTAATARELGFSNVKVGGGHAKAMIQDIPHWIEPGAGALIHIAGDVNPGPLSRALESLGFVVRTAPLYRAVPVGHMPDAAIKAFGANALDAVLLYSPRTAQTFTSLANREGLANRCRNLVACCISRPTAEKLSGLPFREIRQAIRPDQDSVLALLG